MRRRIANYTIHTDTGIIVDEPLLRIADIRLIVNETQKAVLCSSMKKDTILNVENLEGESVIWLEPGFHLLKKGDQLTIEIDKGDNLSTIAKQGENQEATNTAILSAIKEISNITDEYASQLHDIIGE